MEKYEAEINGTLTGTINILFDLWEKIQPVLEVGFFVVIAIILYQMLIRNSVTTQE